MRLTLFRAARGPGRCRVLSVGPAARLAVAISCSEDAAERWLLGSNGLARREPRVANVKSESASARLISWFETSRKGSTSDHAPVSFGFSCLSGADPTITAYSTSAGGSSEDLSTEMVG